MTTTDLILSTLKSNKSKIAQFGITSVGLFGSYSRNEQSENSDIDILIDFEPNKESFDNLMAACEFFEQLFKSQRVDIVTKKGLSPHIGPKILNEVKYV
jgi:hypothetical protein